MSEKKEYNIDTMTGVGKKLQLAGREYEVLPVNIEDMHYIIGDNPDERLYIVDKKDIESGKAAISIFGFNVQGERKNIFMKIINKYVFYKEKPMTEKLLIEHNWSFKEIAHFLWFWIQDVSE